MRYIGIDYGTKNIGIALSDEAADFAFPHSVWANDKSFISKLKKLVTTENVEAIVFGIPLNFKGEETNQTRLTKAFASGLESVINVPIFFENEVLTTAMAKRIQGDSPTIDSSAAALILSSFLQRKKNKNMIK